MKEFRLKGSYRNMGITFGKTLSNWHRTFRPSEVHLKWALECEKAVKRYAPSILDELSAIADVSDATYEGLLATHLTPAFAFGCTLFAVSGEHTANGKPIYGRQQDWEAQDVEALHVIHAEPDDGHKSIGFSFGDCGRYGGQNEAGVTIASAYAPAYIGKAKPGVRMNISARWALDKFSTTEEVVEYYLKIPHTEPVIFLVADSAGTIARIETTPERTETAISEDGIEVVTNFFMLDGMKDLDRGWPEENHVYEYYRRAERWCKDKKGSLTLADAKTVCSDHEIGICHHDKVDNNITIWSWVTEIGSPNILEIAQGSPCKNEYRQLK